MGLEATDFIVRLFGRKTPDGTFAQLWNRESKLSTYIDTAGEAGKLAKAHPNDTYVCVSLAPRRYTPARRHPAREAVGIAGLWVDLDVNGGPAAKHGYAPSHEEAIELANAERAPTLIVNSGYGIQAWWLFDEPWIFGRGEREKAALIERGWLERLRRMAGWKIDAVQDLARLMRLPGTFNAKVEPVVPVTLYDSDEEGPRYKRSDFDELAIVGRQAAAPVHGATGALSLRADASPPPDRFDVAIENVDGFARAWRRGKGMPGRPSDFTASEWDLSLASMAVRVGWSDQEIADLIIAARRKHGDSLEKATREDYMRRTIGKARGSDERKIREQQRSEVFEELGDIAEDAAPNQDRTMHLFNELVGGPEIKELIQLGRRHDSARFALALANGQEVHLGEAAVLFNLDRFRVALATAVGAEGVVGQFKRSDWLNAVRALMRTAVVREQPEEEPETLMREWMRAYLDRRMAEDAAETHENRQPFIRDGWTYVSGEDLTRFLWGAMGERRFSKPDVRAVLLGSGFERWQLAYTRPNGRRGNARYFRIRSDEL